MENSPYEIVAQGNTRKEMLERLAVLCPEYGNLLKYSERVAQEYEELEPGNCPNRSALFLAIAKAKGE